VHTRHLAFCIVLATVPTQAAPAGAQPAVHAIWASMPDAPWDAAARSRLDDNLRRLGLGLLETADVASPPAPRAPALLREGMAAVERLQFDAAHAALDAAVAEAVASGGAGLAPAELADLFLYQAMAAQQATWRDLESPLTEIAPPAARQAYLRAAVLAPDRVLPPRRFPPLAVASWALAVAAIAERPRGMLTVRAPQRARISIDGAASAAPPASRAELPYGEHFVRVEEVGHRPWAALVGLTEPTLAIERPAVAPLSFDDQEAAARARRMGASFALLAQLQLAGRPAIELRLVNAITGARQDATIVPFEQLGDQGALAAALMRLDEQVRRAELERRSGARPGQPHVAVLPPLTSAPPPPLREDRPALRENPGAWLRLRWPLVTAIGVAVLSSVVLGVAVSR
jgi:hypothetical protein